MPRTLRGGSGYGIAAQTPNVPNVVSEEITKLAGYVEIYPGKDPNRIFNPINYFFYKFNSWYILGRIISAENDYSGRFNYLGQFFVLEQNELQECGPAAILKDLPFIDTFQGEARTLPPFMMPRCVASNSSICKSWEAATGDAGWGGFLAEKIRANQTNPILYDKSLHGTKALALIAESLNLLSPAERWGTTFSTHVEGFPKGNQVRVRMLQQGGDLTREFKSNPGTLDLTKGPLELGTESGLITEARTGKRPSAVKEQLLRQPEPVVVVGQADFENSGPIGLAVEAGMPEIPGQKSKNWVATPPNLTPPKMGKQNRINYGRDTDEYPKETFERNRKSGGISPLFLALATASCLGSLLLGIFIGTFINKAGLEETQKKVEEQEKNIENTMDKNDKKLHELQNKNKKEEYEKKQIEDDLNKANKEKERLKEEIKKITNANWKYYKVDGINKDDKIDEGLVNYLKNTDEKASKFSKFSPEAIDGILQKIPKVDQYSSETDLIKKIKKAEILESNILEFFKDEIGYAEFDKYLKNNHDMRPRLIYDISEDDPNRIEKLKKILEDKKFVLQIGKEFFEGGIKDNDIPKNKGYYTLSVQSNVKYDGKDTDDYFNNALTKKEGKDAFYEMLVKMNNDADSNGLFFFYADHKISLKTIRYLSRCGDKIIAFLKKDGRDKDYKSVINKIEKIKRLKEKF